MARHTAGNERLAAAIADLTRHVDELAVETRLRIAEVAARDPITDACLDKLISAMGEYIASNEAR